MIQAREEHGTVVSTDTIYESLQGSSSRGAFFYEATRLRAPHRPGSLAVALVQGWLRILRGPWLSNTGASALILPIA